MFLSTKEYCHEIGLSCCFRQWRAKSHCNKLHGYALAVKFVFAAKELDECGWVVDFGGLKPLKQFLEDTFDHKLIIASDDPHLRTFEALGKLGLANVICIEYTGCEAFADFIFNYAELWLIRNYPHTKLISVEVKEHGANSAIRLADGAL
jgi:6-pyruvoyltetrahydropterin/6-carboxytetrahydropterin synthase